MQVVTQKTSALTIYGAETVGQGIADVTVHDGVKTGAQGSGASTCPDLEAK